MHLTYSVLQREADLRFALVRVRENAGKWQGEQGCGCDCGC